MIINPPTASDLLHTALRLYFSAWGKLLTIQEDFDETFPDGASSWQEEHTEYLSACQEDLQAICAIIQHSQELSLKAKICEISPYLLLSRPETKISATRKNIDFSEFRTIDSADLPAAVNTYCPDGISDKFIAKYNETRAIRNKVLHLGNSATTLHYQQIFKILISQYLELWAHRPWLNDYLLYASHGRMSFFHDGRYSSAHSSVMYAMQRSFSTMSNMEFKRLFKHSKNEIRYICHHCVDHARTKYLDLVPDDYSTAYIDVDQLTIYCLMCNETRKVERHSCPQKACGGKFISAEDDQFAGTCHSCGE